MKKRFKKTLSFVLGFLLFAFVFPLAALAQDNISGVGEVIQIDENKNGDVIQTTIVEGEYEYRIIDGGAEITRYTGNSSNVLIPSTLAGKKVIKIGSEAFGGCYELTNVVIPEGVTSIGYCSFKWCENLKTITIPESVTSIDKLAFWLCRSLTVVDLPENLTSIGEASFTQCESLTEINLSEVTAIGSSAFSHCSSLTEIDLSSELTSIGELAFFNCSKLRSIQFNSASTQILSTEDGISATIPKMTAIIGFNPSTAKTYALKNGNLFQTIGEAATLEKIEITNPVARSTYQIGEKLDLNGLVVTGTYSDGTTKTESITEDNIYGFNSSKNNSNLELTINVKGKTASFFICIADINCTYRTHIQNEGWQEWKSNGNMSGTSGKSLRLEGIEINVYNQGYDLGIEYSTHVQNEGWQNFKSNGAMSGTSNQSLRLEGIKIRLTGTDANKFDIYYRVHAQNFGWLDWAKNGNESGTTGFGYRLEAIEILVLPKDATAPGYTDKPFIENN